MTLGCEGYSTQQLGLTSMASPNTEGGLFCLVGFP